VDIPKVSVFFRDRQYILDSGGKELKLCPVETPYKPVSTDIFLKEHPIP